MNLIRFFRFPILAISAFFLALSPAAAQVKESDLLRTSATFKKAFKDVVAKPSQSVVRVLCDGKETALGMVVGPDGWILTKAADLKGKIVCKLKDGKDHEAVLVGKQEPHDLALLKIDVHGLVPVEFKESKKAAVGDWAASVGTGDEPVAIGVISVGTRNVSVPKINFAPPDPKSGYLGVQLEPAKGGVLITVVMPDTAAAKAGFKVNDMILAFNGMPFTDRDALIQAVGKHKPGDVVTLKIKRGDEEKELKATLGKRPPGANRGDIQDQMGSQLSSRRAGYPTILQHDSVIKPTDCGSPLVDLEGKVLGINVSRAGRTETWTVPSEVIQSLLFDLMSGKLAPKDQAAVQKPTPAELRIALKKAEEERAQLDKRLADIKTALAKAEAQAKEQAQREQAVDRLLELMNQRLALMTDVAKTKWNSKLPIADPERERQQLDLLVTKAKEQGLSKDVVERFFQAQFAAAGRAQELHHQAWAKSGQQAFAKARDLAELRTAIDQVNLELLAAFAKIQSAMGEGSLQERLQTRAAQMLTGVRDEIRTRALEPLLKK